MKKFLTIALILHFIFGFAAAEELPKTINVVGYANIAVSPDMAKLNIGVTSVNKKVEAAQEQSNSVIHDIVTSLKDKNIPEADIVTSNFSVYPIYDYNSTTIKSYQVENTIQVTLKDINIIGEIIDLAIEKGANNAYNIIYESSQSFEIYLKALERATEYAQKKATAIANSLGKKLSDVISVSESAPYNKVFSKAYRSADFTEQASTEIMPSDIEITAEIQMTYRFE